MDPSSRHTARRAPNRPRLASSSPLPPLQPAPRASAAPEQPLASSCSPATPAHLSSPFPALHPGRPPPDPLPTTQADPSRPPQQMPGLTDDEVVSEMRKMVSRRPPPLCATGVLEGDKVRTCLLRAALTPHRLCATATDGLHQAGGAREGARDQGQGRRRVCHREGASPLALIRVASLGLRCTRPHAVTPNTRADARLLASRRTPTGQDRPARERQH